MLKSTHRLADASSSAQQPLPAGWTEHRAPTGHTYYHNTETKQSTYTRPVTAPEPEELLIDYGATQPDAEMQASLNAMQQFHKNNDPSAQGPGHFTGGRSYQDRDRDHSKPNRQGDRSKSKVAIPDCAPWVLVKTRYGRRFVHNTETKESLWKFPSEVMMAVIDMDRVEWQKKKEVEEQKQKQQLEDSKKAQEVEPKLKPASTEDLPADYNSDEYEEVEVTDDEAGDDANPTSKRLRLEESSEHTAADQPPVPQELTEDDIAWQLAQMEAEDEDPGYDYGFDDQDDEEGGMPLTKEDKEALFRNLLDDYQISPFSTFDALIEMSTTTANAVISDDRWTALPNMGSRRAAFGAWSKDRIAERNAVDGTGSDAAGQGATNGSHKKASKPDPRVSYLRFLAQEATPKLYWPEFKRKFRKAPEITDRYFADKDREKLYREYIVKLKISDADRKKELTTLLKGVPTDDWTSGNVPLTVEKDVRFYGVRDERSRKELVDGFIATLPKM